MHHRDPREVVRLRRRGRRPLERVRFPRVVTGWLSVAEKDRVDVVPDEYEDRGRDDVRPDRRDEVEARPFRRLGVVERAPRHALETELVHREERHVHADEEEEEVNPAELLAEHAAADLRHPVVERGERAEERALHEDVVDVRHHEVRVRELHVHRHGAQEHTRDAADREDHDERHREEHRRTEPERAAPQCPEPGEDLHAGGDRDEHRRRHKEDLQCGVDARDEHMVYEHAEREEADRG